MVLIVPPDKTAAGLGIREHRSPGGREEGTDLAWEWEDAGIRGQLEVLLISLHKGEATL